MTCLCSHVVLIIVLFGYPMNEWRKLEEKLKDLPVTKKDARAFTRFFFSGATEVEIDKQGRINIPTTLSLCEYGKRMCRARCIESN